MENEQYLESIMGLIMYGGDAKSNTIEAIRAAKKYQFEEAQKYMEMAKKSLSTAHHSQTDLLTKEASGEHVPLSLLMVHGQDHLMTALLFIDMANEVIDVYKALYDLKRD